MSQVNEWMNHYHHFLVCVPTENIVYSWNDGRSFVESVQFQGTKSESMEASLLLLLKTGALSPMVFFVCRVGGILCHRQKRGRIFFGIIMGEAWGGGLALDAALSCTIMTVSLHVMRWNKGENDILLFVATFSRLEMESFVWYCAWLSYFPSRRNNGNVLLMRFETRRTKSEQASSSTKKWIDSPFES